MESLQAIFAFFAHSRKDAAKCPILGFEQCLFESLLDILNTPFLAKDQICTAKEVCMASGRKAEIFETHDYGLTRMRADGIQHHLAEGSNN